MHEEVAWGVVVYHDEAGIGHERYSIQPDVNRQNQKVAKMSVFTPVSAASESESNVIVETNNTLDDIVVSEQPSEKE